MSNTIKESLNHYYNTLGPYIKYNPLNNYNWNSQTTHTRKLKNLLDATLPWTIFLPSSKGHLIHSALSLFNIGVSLKAGSPDYVAIAQVVGNCFDPRISLCLELGQRAFSLARSENTLEEAVHFASSFLNVGLCLKTTKREALILTIAQALLQSTYSFYTAYKTYQKLDRAHKWEALPLLTRATLGTLHLTRAYRASLALYKLQSLAHKIFIVMRHADRERIGDESKITEKGILRSQEAAKVVKNLQEKYGKKDVHLLSSDLIRSQQTAWVIAESLETTNAQTDTRVHERYNHSSLSHKERKDHPQSIKFEKLSPEEQYYREKVPGYESTHAQYQRMKHAVEDFVGQTDLDQLPVVVSHTIAIKSYVTGLQKFEHSISDLFKKGTKYCEMLVFRVTEEGKFEELERVKVDLPENKVSQ